MRRCLGVLRDDLALRAAKRVCNQSLCSACTEMIDGVPIRACLPIAGACEGRGVTTFEGFAADPTMQALREAIIASGGLQCGICTGGVLITARNLMEGNPKTSGVYVPAALSGNPCRCTGYYRILDAVTQAIVETAR